MQDKNKFLDILEKSIETLKSEKLLDELTNKIHDELGTDIKKAKEIVDDISITIDIIDQSYKDLKEAKESGKSRQEWLKGRLQDALKQYTEERKEEYIKEIITSLDNVNKEIGIEIFDKNIDFSKPPKSYSFDELNAQAIIDNLQNQLKNNTMLEAVIAEDGNSKVDIKHKEIKAVKEYFETKLDSDYDRNFKKAISVAINIAKNKDLLPEELKDKTPDEIAIIVDKGVTSAKVAYKLAQAELNPIDAVEYIIDRNTAILNSAIVRVTTKYGGLVGGKIGGYIGSIFGPAGTVTGTAIGTTVGKLAGYEVGEFISKGVKKLASGAKSIANKAWDRVKSTGSKVASLFRF